MPDTLAHEMAIARGKILEQERLDGFGAIEIADEVLATSDSPTRKGKADNLGFRHRRMTFPAGKIYHLVPARLVLGKAIFSHFPLLQTSRQTSCAEQAQAMHQQ